MDLLIQTCPAPRPYGFFRFMLDVMLFFATGGLWLIWILIREIRKG